MADFETVFFAQNCQLYRVCGTPALRRSSSLVLPLRGHNRVPPLSLSTTTRGTSSTKGRPTLCSGQTFCIDRLKPRRDAGRTGRLTRNTRDAHTANQIIHTPPHHTDTHPTEFTLAYYCPSRATRYYSTHRQQGLTAGPTLYRVTITRRQLAD